MADASRSAAHERSVRGRTCPIAFDLDATRPPDEQETMPIPATYRVFEVWPENIEATARHLRSRDWLGAGICPLVLANMPAASWQPARLPSAVPWISLTGAAQMTIQALREVLVLPLESRGFFCVDFVDYASALTFGGEIRLFRAVATDLPAAAESIRSQLRSDDRKGSEAAVCLAIHVCEVIPWDQLTFAIETILGEFEYALMHVASFNQRHSDQHGVSISLLTVSSRN